MQRKKLLRLFVFQIIWVCLHSDVRADDPDSDKNMDLCVNGNCPWCLEIAPFFAKCEENGEGYKFGHLMNCKKYFTCERNPKECESTPWGGMEHNCPEGQYFDVIGKECIASLDCPQKCPPKADEKTGCKADGTKPSEDSKDCHSGVGCIPVDTCPANIYETYWTSGTISCWGEDEFYHAKHGKCVKAMACPQSVPEENCDLKWDLMAEKGWDRGNEDMINICRSWIPSLGQYAYGWFYFKPEDPKKKCVVEQGIKSEGVLPVDKYEVLSKDNHLHIVWGGAEREERKDAATYTFLGKKYTFITCGNSIGKHDQSEFYWQWVFNRFGDYHSRMCWEQPTYKIICV